MSSIFNPVGSLNIAVDPSDLPGSADGNNEIGVDMTRCKNLRLDAKGKAVTRDGTTKLNATAINPITWIEEIDGVRYAFAGDTIYEDEASLATGLTDAQWVGFQYNAFNDSTKQIFALNGTDRKRVISGSVNEWGIDAPTTEPVLSAAVITTGSGLTGVYNAKYTYVRKVGGVIVAESNPSPAATNSLELNDEGLDVTVAQPTDPQVTHIRLYRTLAGGTTYYLDAEIETSITYTHGYTWDWEATGAYIAGDGFKFTVTDNTHGTENTQSWEESFETQTATSTSTPTPAVNPGRDLETLGPNK